MISLFVIPESNVCHASCMLNISELLSSRVPISSLVLKIYANNYFIK